MASKKIVKETKSGDAARTWRYAVTIGLFTLAAMAIVFGLQRAEQFLIRDPRFALAAAPEYGDESPNLHVQGVRNASRRQVLQVFQPDIGRSLYLLPLSDRRKELRRVAWVKDAAIVRTWPNQVSVRITERQPVAFVQLQAEAMMRWSLIDADGFILDPPQKSSFNLPVITGIRPAEAASIRSTRVHRMLRLLDELGPLRERVSDVDVADLDDLKATVKMNRRAVVLMLGEHNFRSRFQHFLDHFDEIQKHITDMTVLDLRLDDRITVLGAHHGK